MPHVSIVMASRNGGRHIADQLASYAAQTHRDWSLVVSDDRSSDDTRDKVAAFAACHPGRDITVIDGPATGSAAANFLHALASCPDRPDGLVALSDQDDIWLPHRLERAVAALAQAPEVGHAGAVYASRTLLCDAAGRPRQPSRRHPKGPSFGNALVQNILPGNTIVLDPRAAALVRETAAAAGAAREGRGVAHHDWWLYALATGAGAAVLPDDRPGLLYRQHDENLMGAHRGLLRSADRLTMIRDGRYADWVAGNVEALGLVESRLTPTARQLRAQFAEWLAGAPMPFAVLRRAGIARQTLAGNLLLGTLVRRGLLQARAQQGAASPRLGRPMA